jgi:membrane protein DedA with SNARE-associated domain
MLPLSLLGSAGLSEIFSRFSYTGPFVVLLLCGLGFPLPEEVTLIGAGILLHKGEVEFVAITLVCSAAILIGDSIPFLLGRRYGMAALKIRYVAKWLDAERLSRLRRRFQEHGNWTTFACRFLAGVRIPGYFVAGTMRMSYLRFLALDALGVLISVPISIYVGWLFGGKVGELTATMHDLHLVLAFLVVALTLILVFRARRSRIALKEALDLERASRLAAAKALADARAEEALAEAELERSLEAEPDDRSAALEERDQLADRGEAVEEPLRD